MCFGDGLMFWRWFSVLEMVQCFGEGLISGLSDNWRSRFFEAAKHEAWRRTEIRYKSDTADERVRKREHERASEQASLARWTARGPHVVCLASGLFTCWLCVYAFRPSLLLTRLLTHNPRAALPPPPPLPHPSIPLLPGLTLSSSLATVLSAFSLQDLTIPSFFFTREPTSHVCVFACACAFKVKFMKEKYGRKRLVAKRDSYLNQRQIENNSPLKSLQTVLWNYRPRTTLWLLKKVVRVALTFKEVANSGMFI